MVGLWTDDSVDLLRNRTKFLKITSEFWFKSYLLWFLLTDILT